MKATIGNKFFTEGWISGVGCANREVSLYQG